MKKYIFLLVIAGLVSACGEDNDTVKTETKKEQVVRTVDWYKEHKEERIAKLKECENNPGELGLTPNCVNASKAKSSSTWSARGGAIKVQPLKPKTTQ